MEAELDYIPEPCVVCHLQKVSAYSFLQAFGVKAGALTGFQSFHTLQSSNRQNFMLWIYRRGNWK